MVNVGPRLRNEGILMLDVCKAAMVDLAVGEVCLVSFDRASTYEIHSKYHPDGRDHSGRSLAATDAPLAIQTIQR